MISPTRSRSARLLFAVPLLLLLLATALPFGAAAQSVTPTPKATKTPKATPTPHSPTKPGFTACKCPFGSLKNIPGQFSFECGYLAVPLNRADPKSPLISLAVAVFTNENATEPDPIVYLAGGPGENSLESLFLSGHRLVIPAGAAHRDLIVFDQRGMGLSQPALDCPEMLELGADALDREIDGIRVTDEEIQGRIMDAATACRKTLAGKTDLAAFNTDASAADVEDLRKALRYKEWNLWGVSYGTRLALEVMRDYPGGVRSVVLDSVFPTDVDVLAEQPGALTRSLRWLYAACLKDKVCNLRTPNLETLFVKTVAKLDNEPLKLRAFDLISGKNYDVLLNGDDLIDLVTFAVGHVPDQAPLLIDEASKGKTTLTQSFITAILMTGHYISTGANYSVMCHDEVAFSTPTAVERALKKHPLVARHYNEGTSGETAFALCKMWNVGSGDPKGNAAVTSDLPTLVTAGEIDPITPPSWGQRVAKSLKNATYVELPGRAHGVTNDEGCGTQLMAAFLDDPEGELDTACAANLRGLTWTPAELKLVSFKNEDMGISGVRPEGWVEMAPGTFNRQSGSQDATALIVQALQWTRADLEEYLVDALKLKKMPKQIETQETKAGLKWTLHRAPTVLGYIDFAIAETDELTIHVLMETKKAEHDELYEELFLPAVDAVEPLE
jgi:pimeloyl-ACP methyl ester carboxylesterase